MDDAPPATLAGQGAGKPLEWIGGLPVYRFGQAPKHLRTRSQLERGMRLRPAAPVCLLRPYMHPDERVFLYDPEDAVPIPFRSAGDEWAWQPLNGGHRALGDCLAVIDCLKAMARDTGADEKEQAA